MMKVKCKIPSRIKECGDCEYYNFPYITSTSNGETIKNPPKCLKGMDLKTQKALCPNFTKRIPHIY